MIQTTQERRQPLFLYPPPPFPKEGDRGGGLYKQNLPLSCDSSSGEGDTGGEVENKDPLFFFKIDSLSISRLELVISGMSGGGE